MEYRQLGKTDIRISRIGFGCWAIGGHGYGPVNDAESIRTVQKSSEFGINFFDTADVYGFGHSEEILSTALGASRHEAVIATKFGVRWDDQGRTRRDCSPKALEQALEQSLRRLKIDCIPLYQIHWYDGKTPLVDVMESLERAQQKGKIRHIGCSNFSAAMVREAAAVHRLESIQLPYSVIERECESVLGICRSHFQMSGLVYGVLARGLLTGKFSAEARFTEGDTRASDPAFSGEKFRKHRAAAGRLKDAGRKYGRVASQLAIRWALENPSVDAALVGVKTVGQLDANLGALEFSLNEGDRATLTSFFD